MEGHRVNVPKGNTAKSGEPKLVMGPGIHLLLDLGISSIHRNAMGLLTYVV